MSHELSVVLNVLPGQTLPLRLRSSKLYRRHKSAGNADRKGAREPLSSCQDTKDGQV